MRFEVSIFVESTWKGPARRRGVAMWIVECKRNGVPVTREGLIRLEDGTENMANLMAITGGGDPHKRVLHPSIYSM